ncbi:hypothetical protein [Streptomyces sp. AK02-01A]|uniref:hypothetical protein n=1 Tax=Streptomyces sp. AK02-01A TaxID=3028648 RepID=UPI0029B98EEF|nr:hypothetical protein [Streptomyces sp. AK02-01A]MDX3853081.1 hypothetical protein [Streptomyces sp. AK02-01A]
MALSAVREDEPDGPVKGTLIIVNTRTTTGNKTVVEKDTKSMAGERSLTARTGGMP